MKYMVLIAGAEDQRDDLSEQDRAAVYQRMLSWWEQQSKSG